MAENIVGGLFGMMPEDVAAQRMAALDQQAQAFGRMSSDEAYKTLGYKAGNLLGQGLFGVNDPQMERARQRQQMSQGIDFNDPESLLQAAQRANQAGDTQAAQALYSKSVSLRQAQALLTKTQAETTKALREPNQFQRLLEKGDFTAESIKQAQATGDISQLVRVDKTKVNYGDNAEIEAQALFGVPFSSLNQSQAKQVADSLEAKGIKRASAGAAKPSTVIKEAPNITAAIGAFETLVKPYRETYNSAETAQQLLNEAAKSKNSQSFEAARTTIAKAIGENKLSNEDIKRTGLDPRLVQGALDWVNKKIEGVPNEDIIKQMYAVSTALRNKAAERINEQSDRAQEAARSSEFKGDLQLYFPRVKVNIPPTKGGTFDADKEARYQEYKRKQGQ